MKNWTIAKRITFGFSAVLVILILVGVYAIMQMNSAVKGSGYLSNDYLPELEIVSKMQSGMGEVRANARSYQFTGEADFLKKTKAALADLGSAIKEAEQLASKSTKLVVLKEEIRKAPNLYSSYEQLLLETEKANESYADAAAESTRYGTECTNIIHALQKNQSDKLSHEIAEGSNPVALEERHAKINALIELVDLMNDMRISNLQSQLKRDSKIFESGMKRFENHRAIIDKVTPLFKVPEDVAALKQIEQDMDAYAKSAQKQSKFTISVEEISERRAAALSALGEFASDIAAGAQNGANKLASQSSKDLTLAANLTEVGVGVATLIGICVALIIIASTTKVLKNLTSILSSSADQVAAAATQVAASSQTLAEGASEQAGSLEEASASLEEISSMTKSNAENTENAKQFSAQTRQAAETGVNDMNEMIAAMSAINESSDNIAKIIKTIDEIAFQTNILALNAAVEAARAGEAGMGFAVVANEVRSLAQKSASAARETAEKIEDSINKSKAGAIISRKVQDRLAVIVSQARQVDEFVAQIATASLEQSQGIEQLNVTVTQMDQVTQINAASAEESASASEQLNSQAEMLRDAIADLKVIVDGKRNSAPSRKKSSSTVRPIPISSLSVDGPAPVSRRSPFGESLKSKLELPSFKSKMSSKSSGDDFQDF